MKYHHRGVCPRLCDRPSRSFDLDSTRSSCPLGPAGDLLPCRRAGDPGAAGRLRKY